MSNPHQGSPGAPHLSYSTPATGRRSSYASVAAGAPSYSATFGTHDSVPPPLGPIRGLSTNPAPSVHLPRINNEQPSRIPQPISDSETQADATINMPSSWSRGANTMANYSSLRHGSHGHGAGASKKGQDRFFIPSYLRGSRYMEKLEAVHEAKMMAQHTDPPPRSFNGGSLSTSSSSVSLQKMAPSHRGMTYDIVENQLQSEEVGPAPLPSKWEAKDKWGGLEIGPSEFDVTFVGAIQLSEQDAAAARTDHPMPPECGIYYYEATIVQKGKGGMIGVGFSGSKASLERLPGWEPDSWAYHGDDGMSFSCQSTGKPYAEQFTTGDIVGCGVDFTTNQAFFTKNGVFLGFAFKDIRNVKLYPSVGMKRPHAHVDVNFGQRPFSFDIDGYVNDMKLSIVKEIESANVRRLHTTLNKEQLSKALVAQYLAHDGYNETAKAFAQELRTENDLLCGTSHSSLDPYLAADDDGDAAHRQTIRTAILDGQIDNAIALINTSFPSVLETHPTIYFRLKCRKFIELMQQIAEHLDVVKASRQGSSSKRSKRSAINGHHTTAHSDDGFEPDMDLDDPPIDIKHNPSSDYDRMDTEDGTPNPDLEASDRKAQELLKEAVLYGKDLKQHFKADQSQLVTETMTKIFGMLAYPNPMDSDQAYLLDKSQRGPVAEAVNSAILVSLGKSSSTALERLYKQTAVLVDLISEDGGEGSFVNINTVLQSVDQSSLVHDPIRHQASAIALPRRGDLDETFFD